MFGPNFSGLQHILNIFIYFQWQKDIVNGLHKCNGVEAISNFIYFFFKFIDWLDSITRVPKLGYVYP